MPFNPRYEIDARGRAIPVADKPSPVAGVGIGINTLVTGQRSETILDWRSEDQNAADVRIFCGVDDGILNPANYIAAALPIVANTNVFPSRASGFANNVPPPVLKVTFGVGGVSNEFYMDASPQQSVVLPASFVRVEAVNIIPPALPNSTIRFSATITKSQGAGKNEIYLTQYLSFLTGGPDFGLNIPPYARRVRFTRGAIAVTQAWVLKFGAIDFVNIPAGVETFELDIPGVGHLITMRGSGAAVDISLVQWKLEL